MQRFDGTQLRVVPLPSNAQLLEDFIALSFGLESGRRLPVLTRFEGPVTVSVVPGAPATLSGDLDQLLVRLRREAGLNIRRVAAGQAASITVEALPREVFQHLVPEAACFVVPNVSNWKSYLAVRSRAQTDWTALRVRETVAVFLPSDVNPQEVRDCLHEEIAQALGPLNDLHRLAWSVYNDDNLNVVLTSYDMLILRVTYDKALRSGMSEAEVRAVLPSVLRRINPDGERPGAPLVPETPRAWSRAIERALLPDMSDTRRVRAASQAVRIARAQGWADVRLGYALLTYGRAALPVDPQSAFAAIVEAERVFLAAYGPEVHSAQAIIQPAAFALTAGKPEVTLQLTKRALASARRGQNAALMSTLLLLQSEALVAEGKGREAVALRREAQAWGLYGFGSDEAVQARTAEVAALRPGL